MQESALRAHVNDILCGRVIKFLALALQPHDFTNSVIILIQHVH